MRVTPFVLIALGLVVGWWWHASLEARDRANHAALEACEQGRVQLLDGTVSFKSVRLGRDARGILALKRTYLFDYSEDGESRRHGFVRLAGREVELVGLGPTLVHGGSA